MTRWEPLREFSAKQDRINGGVLDTGVDKSKLGHLVLLGGENHRAFDMFNKGKFITPAFWAQVGFFRSQANGDITDELPMSDLAITSRASIRRRLEIHLSLIAVLMPFTVYSFKGGCYESFIPVAASHLNHSLTWPYAFVAIDR